MHPLQKHKGQPRAHTSPLSTLQTPQKQIRQTIIRTPLNTPCRSLQLPARRKGDPEHTHLTPTQIPTQPWWVGRGTCLRKPGRQFSSQVVLFPKTRRGNTTTSTTIPRLCCIDKNQLWFVPKLIRTNRESHNT